MERGTKIALGVGAGLGLLFLLSRKGGGGRRVNVIGQYVDSRGRTQPWAGVTLGFGPSNIASAGCVLTTLTMAWNTFNPDSPMTPDVMNDFLKGKPGTFQGDNMFTEVAANAAGMDMPASERVDYSGKGRPTPEHSAAMRAALDLALSRGGLAMIRVDENQDLGYRGDHTMLVFSGGGGSYLAADPQLVTTLTFDGNLFASANNQFGAHFNYQGVGVATIYNS